MPSSSMSPRLFGLLLLTSSCFLFSGMATLLAVSRRMGLSAQQTSLYRLAIGALAMLALLGLSRPLRRPVRQPMWVLVRGVAGGVAVFLYYLTIEKLGIARAAIIVYTFPIFTAVFAGPILGERVAPKVWAMVALAVAGVGLVMLRPGDGGRAEWAYALVGLLTSALSGFAICVVRLCRRTENACVVYFSQCVCGLPVVLLAMAFVGGSRAATPAFGTAWLVLLGVGVTALVAQLLMTYAYKLAHATEGSVVMLLTPCLNVTIGVLAFGERFHGYMLIGGLLVVSSYLFVVFGRPTPVRSRARA